MPALIFVATLNTVILIYAIEEAKNDLISACTEISSKFLPANPKE